MEGTDVDSTNTDTSQQPGGTASPRAAQPPVQRGQYMDVHRGSSPTPVDRPVATASSASPSPPPEVPASAVPPATPEEAPNSQSGQPATDHAHEAPQDQPYAAGPMAQPDGSVPVSPAPADESNPEGEATATDPGNADNPMAIPSVPMKPHRHGSVLGIVVAAALVGTLLAVAAIVVYLKDNSGNGTSKTSKQTSGSNSSAVAPVSAGDVSSNIDEVDRAIQGLNDTTDFSSDDLSDTTLGL